MHVYEIKHPVAHSADEMFALVARVEDYPKFLPLCEELIVKRREQIDGKELFIGAPTQQMTPEFVHFPDLVAVVDRASVPWGWLPIWQTSCLSRWWALWRMETIHSPRCTDSSSLRNPLDV